MDTLEEGCEVDCGLEALDFDYSYEILEDAVPDCFTVNKPAASARESVFFSHQPTERNLTMPLFKSNKEDSVPNESNIAVFRKKLREGVPFLHRLRHALVPNSNFIIDGSIFDNANKFTVDLCAHMMCPRDNVVKKHIAFHFNPRLPMNCVVRNCYVDGIWGEEEIKTFRRNLLKRGLEFVLEIFVSPSEFLVAVNGNHFCSYAHRLPFHEVNSIEIDGDITLNKVELMTSKYYPAISSSRLTSNEDLELPLTKKFTQGISTPTTVVLEGSVYLLPFNCYVNLQCGSHVYPHPLIAFHLSLRWRPSQDDIIVFNSWTDNIWDKEVEFPMCNLLQPGANFVLRIEISQDGYHVIINDFPLPVFPHRMKPDLVDSLVVQGDVKLRRADVLS